MNQAIIKLINSLRVERAEAFSELKDFEINKVAYEEETSEEDYKTLHADLKAKVDLLDERIKNLGKEINNDNYVVEEKEDE